MSILIYRDPETVGTCAATLLASHILSDPKSVLGVDYHESLLPVYAALTQMTEKGLLNWNDTKIYQLFEFLPSDNSGQRIANLLGKALFTKAGVSVEQYTVPYSTEMAPEQVADMFDTSILKGGGLDSALVAVRQDGSLLMTSSANSDPRTHVEIVEGDGFVTIGIAALMQSRHPIVVATGKSFAEAVRSMLKGNLTDSPMAVLRMHRGATFILDEEAASLL